MYRNNQKCRGQEVDAPLFGLGLLPLTELRAAVEGEESGFHFTFFFPAWLCFWR